MSFLVVLWDSGWHEVRPDDTEERKFIRENGGEVMRAALEGERLAERVRQRLDGALYRRTLEGVGR